MSRRDVLGVARATLGLRLNDLDVLAWLSGLLEVGSTTVEFSREDLAQDLYGRRPGGRERQIVSEALDRLQTTRLTMGGYDAAKGETDPVSFVVEQPLLTHVERPPRGSTLWRAQFPLWLYRQISYGHCTYLDWEVLRSLTGVAKRLWTYIEAEDGYAHIPLTHTRLAGLGVATHRMPDARLALRRAAASILAIDTRWKEVTISHLPYGQGDRGPGTWLYLRKHPGASRDFHPRLDSLREWAPDPSAGYPHWLQSRRAPLVGSASRGLTYGDDPDFADDWPPALLAGERLHSRHETQSFWHVPTAHRDREQRYRPPADGFSATLGGFNTAAELHAVLAQRLPTDHIALFGETDVTIHRVMCVELIDMVPELALFPHDRYLVCRDIDTLQRELADKLHIQQSSERRTYGGFVDNGGRAGWTMCPLCYEGTRWKP